VSATVYSDDGYTAVWSETVAAATGVPLRQPLDPYGLYTWLAFHGKFTKSHDDLIDRGFRDGVPRAVSPKANARLARSRSLSILKLEPAGSPHLVTRKASEITPVVPEWLWRRWLPKGKLVVLEGDPSVGKSTVSVDWTARVSAGLDWPDGQAGQRAADVILMTAEDDVADTVVWRLDAHGAAMDRVHLVEAVTEEVDGHQEITAVTLPFNIVQLWEKVEETRAALVIIDVLSAYLGGEVDAHKDAHIRRALQPLVEMARATRTTVVLIRHLRKEGAGKAIYQGNGSIGIAGVARAVHSIGYHPENLEVRVLAPVKVNTEVRPKAITFTLERQEHLHSSRVTWGAEVDVTADQLLSMVPVNPDTQVGMCREAVRELLPAGKEMTSNDFLDALKKLGFSKGTIDRARELEHVKARHIGGFGKGEYNGWMVWRILGI
jgi:nicotinamidase-related amidase